MKARAVQLGSAIALVVLASACKHEPQAASFAQWASVVRATPATVTMASGPEDPAAWNLFDRSVVSGYTPSASETTLLVGFGDTAVAISRLKVHGPAPYRLQVLDENGQALRGFDVDMRRLPSSWSTYDLPSPVPQKSLRVVLRAYGAPAPVPEIELWALGGQERLATSAGSATSATAPTTGTIDVVPSPADPGEADLIHGSMHACATISFEVPRDPATYRQTYLTYRAEHAFRPFVLERALNDKPMTRAEWLTSFAGEEVLVERVDPEALLLGANEWHLCIPSNAETDVHISEVAFVGVVESGADLVDGATDSDGSFIDELTDGTTSTGRFLDAGTPIRVALSRYVAPDAILIRERGRTSRFEFDCEVSPGDYRSLRVRASSKGDEGQVFEIESPPAGCASVRFTPVGRGQTGRVEEVEVVGSGARDRIDWASIQVASPLEHFGTGAWVEGWIARPSSMQSAALRVSVAGAPSDSMAGGYEAFLRRSENLNQPWPVELTAALPDGTTLSRTVVLDRDSSQAVATANDTSFGTIAGTDPQREAIERYGRPGSSTWSDVTPSHGGRVRLGTVVGVDIPQGAVSAPTRVTLNHLDSGTLPPLDPGLVNVTAPQNHGYEFLPHGQRFAKPVTVTVPFDPRLIPEGSSADDVRTYYFDEYSRTWQPLQRANVDALAGTVTSLTDHFTVMIDAVLAVPENPTPLGFDPTSLSSLAAANPAANVDFIAPPEANANGDANLHLPIWTPQGRGAYSPSVAVQYSSGAGNGWVGRGWNIRVPSIDVETRFGVPDITRAVTSSDPARVDAQYVFEGMSLVPTSETDGPTCMYGGSPKRYRPRIEGAFAHILRCGSSVDGYHFEVHTKDGTLLTFGDSPDGSSVASLRAPARSGRVRGVGSWFLRTAVDRNGNTTTYRYQADSGTSDGGEPWVAVYPEGIDYTSQGDSTPAFYHVDFTLDDGTRADSISSGRLGFKTLVRKRLRAIRVRAGDAPVRDYVFVYRAASPDDAAGGADPHFYKSLLERVLVYGTGGCEAGLGATVLPSCTTSALFYEHAFEYHSEGPGAFDTAQEWAVEDDSQHDMTEAVTEGAAGHLYVGIGPRRDKSPGGGVALGIGGSLRQAQVALQDVNGDGLVDQIVRPGVHGTPYALLNQVHPGTMGSLSRAAPFGDPASGQGPIAIRNLNELGRDANVFFHFGAQGFWPGGGASASFGHSVSIGRAFLEDLNGDGFVDLVDRRHETLFGRRATSNGQSVYEFVPSALGGLDLVSSANDTALAGIRGDVQDKFYVGDPVRRFVAPYTGRVRIAANARRLHAGPSDGDGAFVELYRNVAPTSSSPWGSTVPLVGCGGANGSCRVVLANADTSPHAITPTNGLLVSVTAGDVLYLKVGTGTDVPYEHSAEPSQPDVPLDAVDASMRISYEQLCPASGPCSNVSNQQQSMHDANGGAVYTFDTAQDFRLVGGLAPAITLPATGHATFDAVLAKNVVATDDVHVCVQVLRSTDGSGNEIPGFSTDVPCSSPMAMLVDEAYISAADLSATPLHAEFDTRAGDLIVVRVESDLVVDPNAFALTAVGRGVVYSSVCDAEGHCQAPASTCCSGTSGATACNASDQDHCACVDGRSIQPFFPGHHDALRTSPDRYVAQTMGPAHVGASYLVFARSVALAIRTDMGPQRLLSKVVNRSCPANDPCVVTTSADFNVVPGQSVSVELVIEPNLPTDTLAFNGLANIEVGASTGHPAVIGTQVFQRIPNSEDVAFAGEYRQFSYGVWNEAEPFEPHLVRLWRDQDKQKIEDHNTDLTLPKKTQPLRTSWAGSTVFPNVPAWVAASDAAFVTSAVAHAARTGGRSEATCGLDSVDVSSGLSPEDYARMSVTNTVQAGADIGQYGASISHGWTKTTTDVVDLDGDGIADTVTDHDIHRGTIAVAGRSRALPDIPLDSEFRRRISNTYSFSLGVNPTVLDTSSGGRPISANTRMPSTSLGAGIAVARSMTERDLIDLNGDGLLDIVERPAGSSSLTVRTNLGFGFTDPESIELPLIEDEIDGLSAIAPPLRTETPNALGHETTATVSANLGIAEPIAQYGGSLNFNVSSTRTVVQFADINGDGLPDLLFKRSPRFLESSTKILVAFNLGSRFSSRFREWEAGSWGDALSTSTDLIPPRVKRLLATVNQISGVLVGPDVLSSTGRLSIRSGSVAFEAGGYFTIPICLFPLAGTPWLHINPGASVNFETDAFQMQLVDVDGDGAADHVVRRGDRGVMYVKHNQITGREGLLSRVVTPLGGSIGLAYERTPNSVDMPHSKYVLSRVVVDDGIEMGAGFESPSLVTRYRYEGGYYDRAEKEFFGFRTVTSERMAGDAVMTRLVETFENRDYWLRGSLLRTALTDAAGRKYHETVNEYAAVAVRDDHSRDVLADPACLADLHPLLPDTACLTRFPARLKTTSSSYEGDDPNGPKVHIEEWTSYDRFGNVLHHVDHGDDSTSADDLATDVAYDYDVRNWHVSRPSHVTATGIGLATPTILRERSATYDAAGNLHTISIETGAGQATTTIDRDGYGNAHVVTTPPNGTQHASQTYTYDYDASHHHFVTKVVDGFGLTSSTTYDLAFGLPEVSTDTSGNTLSRSYDGFGRLVAVTGPYAIPAAPDVQIAYTLGFPHQRGGGLADPTAIATTKHHASAPAGYTGALPPDVVTAIVVDGLGQEAQRSVTATVDGTAGTTTTTRGAHDLLGRQVLQWLPSFAPSPIGSFVTPASTFATASDYDLLDRPVRVTFPDGSVAAHVHDLAPVPGGAVMYRSTFTDGNGHSRETFTDEREQMIAFVEHPSANAASETKYEYDPIGSLVGITDAEGNRTSIAYDRRGLMTTFDNPDTGRIDSTYDLMGNMVERVDPNHRERGTSVTYEYDRDRLVRIDYPSKPDVTMSYGAASARDNSAGRVVNVTDETGTMTTAYGKLGEVRSESRVVFTSTGPRAYSFVTGYTYDSFNRLLGVTYPDGESLAYTYDTGGALTSAVGTLGAETHRYADQVRYDVFGNRTHVRYGNGTESTWTHDPRMQRLATTRTTLSSGQEVQDLSYGYDRVGNLTSMTSQLPTPRPNSNIAGPGSWSMQYDGVDRLRVAHGDLTVAPHKTTSYDATFDYSPSHNLLHKTRVHTVTQPGGAQTHPPQTQLDLTYVYSGPRPHAPTLVGDLEIQYDASGNPISRKRNGATQNLTWDDDGRLVEVQSTGAHLIDQFDASGRRVIKKGMYGETLFVNSYFDLRNGVKGTKHVFAGGLRVASTMIGFAAPNVDASGTFTGTCGPPGQGGTNPGMGGGTPPGHCPPYVDPGAGGSTSTPTNSPNTPARTYYFHLDHLGSTSVLTTDTGEVHEYLQYFPDGEVWIDNGPQNPVNGFRFSGKEYDPETGFYDFGQRFYDPSSSLWLGADPALRDGPRSAVGRPSTMAAYAYAAHSPFVWVDPDGRDPETVEAVGMSLLGGAVAFVDANTFGLYSRYVLPAAIGSDNASYIRRNRAYQRAHFAVSAATLVMSVASLTKSAGTQLANAVTNGGRTLAVASGTATSTATAAAVTSSDVVAGVQAASGAVMMSSEGTGGRGNGTGGRLSRSDHAVIRNSQGRPVPQASQDLTRARRSDVFVQDNGRFVVRGPRGREHILEPDGTHVTSLVRSNAAHRARVQSGTIRPATQAEYAQAQRLVQ